MFSWCICDGINDCNFVCCCSAVLLFCCSYVECKKRSVCTPPLGVAETSETFCLEYWKKLFPNFLLPPSGGVVSGQFGAVLIEHFTLYHAIHAFVQFYVSQPCWNRVVVCWKKQHFATGFQLSTWFPGPQKNLLKSCCFRVVLIAGKVD